MEQTYPSKPFIVISFIDPGDSKPKITSVNREDILTIEVSDVDDPVFAKKYGKKLLTDEQAGEIIDFTFKNLDKIEEIHCHCNAGISRSSGTIAALSRILLGDDQDIFDNPLKLPNMHIYRKLLNYAYENNFWDPFSDNSDKG